MILMTQENYQDRCRCAHTLIAHVHYNGDLGLPENATTYCGVPDKDGEECECREFRKSESPFCVCGHQIGFHIDGEQELECSKPKCDCKSYQWEKVRVAKIQDGENLFYTDDLQHPKAKGAEIVVMGRTEYKSIPASQNSQEFFNA